MKNPCVMTVATALLLAIGCSKEEEPEAGPPPRAVVDAGDPVKKPAEPPDAGPPPKAAEPVKAKEPEDTRDPRWFACKAKKDCVVEGGGCKEPVAVAKKFKADFKKWVAGQKATCEDVKKTKKAKATCEQKVCKLKGK